ncbi:MAG: stage II sporulation protein P, partial [Faecalibacterium sp.]|nr:stage II sporulation protein P [Faecalibacterium sp.]
LGEGPQILIVHTHGSEADSQTDGDLDEESDPYRTTDCTHNVVRGGEEMATVFRAHGFQVIHDTTLYDYPAYNGAYERSLAAVEDWLGQYPTIKVVLDVHRDAIERENGTRCAPVCTIDGRQAAQVMIICGCDNGTSVQLPAWRQNLRFAAAWERSMEAKYPGLTRPVLFSYRFYNQDLTTGSLLIEIGGHGNNLNEALYAGYLAAQGLVETLLG